MNTKLVIIPTYDEKENVGLVSEAIFDVSPRSDLLFVDDNSPDGTGKVLDEMAAKDDRLHVMHRQEKNGLGRAYIAGFEWALERKYEFIIGMDADFSHDPAEIPNMIEAVKNADLVVGSRYVDGIRITNWPLSRLLLSKTAATYVRTITGIPVADPTSGFRCYRREVLEALDLDQIISNGYSFLVEMAHTSWIKGFRIVEIPITFEDRRAGYSKMDMKVFRESLCMVWRLAFRCGFRRTPASRPSQS
ncbi:MAG: polyprenol monophosphomannose synthase [Kiritimatiellia bacterium]|jgi:dolichol-phosphate mannosyltransferase|nr:polyprenol monophosphomannose synthase [Kiritimatiellia bacterium]